MKNNEKENGKKHEKMKKKMINTINEKNEKNEKMKNKMITKMIKK